MPKSSTRPDRRRAFFASTAWLVGPLLPMNSVLARVLIDDPQIDALAEHLVSGRHNARERAVALHDFVRDEIRFGFTPHFYAMSAADVLAARIGYGQTKATLFIALLRAVGIEARQQFVDFDAAVWRGLLDLHTPFVDHSYTEVRLGGAWIPTDSYVVDMPLFRAAQAALRTRNTACGFGIIATGYAQWDGRSPAFAQFPVDAPSMSRHRWGVFNDVAAFYEATPEAWNCRTDAMRVVHPLAALTANQAAEALRSGGPSAAHGRLRARA